MLVKNFRLNKKNRRERAMNLLISQIINLKEYINYIKNDELLVKRYKEKIKNKEKEIEILKQRI